MEQIYPSSTLAQFKAFYDSNVWSDMKREVQSWLDDIRNQLEVCNDEALARQLRGNAEACRYFLSLPESLIQAMEDTYGRLSGPDDVRNNQ